MYNVHIQLSVKTEYTCLFLHMYSVTCCQLLILDGGYTCNKIGMNSHVGKGCLCTNAGVIKMCEIPSENVAYKNAILIS